MARGNPHIRVLNEVYTAYKKVAEALGINISRLVSYILYDVARDPCRMYMILARFISRMNISEDKKHLVPETLYRVALYLAESLKKASPVIISETVSHDVIDYDIEQLIDEGYEIFCIAPKLVLKEELSEMEKRIMEKREEYEKHGPEYFKKFLDESRKEIEEVFDELLKEIRLPRS